MADEANFTVRLVDKVTGKAKVVGKAFGRLDRIGQKSAKVAGKTWGALMGTKGGIGGARGKGGKFLKGQKGLLDKMFGKGSPIRKNAESTWKDIAGGNLAAMAVSKTLELGAAAVRATADMVTFGERSRLALNSLAKHGAKGTELFDLAQTLAVKYGNDVMETTENLQKLLASQFSPKLASSIIAMGADLRSIGGSADAAHRAVVAITQIKGTGKLQGDELMQLAEAGISLELVRGEIGKLMGGKSVEEVIKAQTAGKIDADTAIQGILNAVQKKTGESKLGEAGENFAKTTIEGMIGRGKALAQKAGLKITDAITGSINKFIGGKLNNFWDFLESPAGVATIESIGKTLDVVVGVVTSFGEAAAEGFGTVFDTLQPLLKSLGGGDGTTAVMVAKSIGKWIGFMAGVVAAAAIGVGVLAGGIMFLSGAIAEGATAAVEGLISGVGDIILWFDELEAKIRRFATDVWEGALSIGTAIVHGIAAGIAAVATAPIDAIKNVGSSMISGLKSVIDMHSPPGEFVDIGFASSNAVALGSNQGLGAVENAGFGLGTAHLAGLADGLGAKGNFSSPSFSAGFAPSTSFDFSNMAPTSFGTPVASSSGESAASAAPSGRGGRMPSISIPITIEGGGRDNEDLANLAGTSVRRELEAIFRQFELEG